MQMQKKILKTMQNMINAKTAVIFVHLWKYIVRHGKTFIRILTHDS